MTLRHFRLKQRHCADSAENETVTLVPTLGCVRVLHYPKTIQLLIHKQSIAYFLLAVVGLSPSTNLGDVPSLVILTALGALLLGGWAAVRGIRAQPAIFRQVLGAAVVEGLMVALAFATAIRQLRGIAVGDALLLWGYLVTALLLLPGAVAWAFADRSAASSWVLAGVGITVVIMMWRVWQVAGL